MPMPKLTYTAYIALAALFSGQSIAAETHFTDARIADQKMLLRYEHDPSAPILAILHGFDIGSIEYGKLVAQLDKTYSLTLPLPVSSTPDLIPTNSDEENSPVAILAAIDMLVTGTEFSGVSLLVEGYAVPVGIRLATRDEEEIARRTYSTKVDFQHQRDTNPRRPVQELVTKYMID
ncbi:hypothetical protein [uncultured Tateyamaria sp.]|uniref:hypothetical protein n=1 Tax=uncultured Tateyamaria sp. TaxID=455651 RepID=UPI0026027D1B|nr:hypothetical protein [uncultured Tateyamaria sp.]